MPRFLTPVLIALLVMYSMQQMLAATLAPLSHDLDLTATQLGLVFTIAAVSLTLSSPLWGWAFDAVGLRAVLIAGLALCLIGLAGFAAAVAFASDETLTPGVAFTFVLVFRSVLLGAGLAALPVAALAVAGTVTVDEGDRTRAVGLVGAAQGLASVIGPPVGGALAAVSLLVPLYVAPVIALLVAIPVLLTVKAPERPHYTVQTRPWELLPAFGVGFLLYLSLALVQVVIVFIAADRLETSADAGTALAFSAIGLVLTQGVLVALLKWPAARLMRTGAPIALAGYAVLAVAPSLWMISVAFLVAAVGLGLALTGFAAAASLGVGPRHQGLVAGLVTATAGLTFIAGPMLSTVLYDVDPIAPVLAAGAAAALAVAVTLVPVTPKVPQSVA